MRLSDERKREIFLAVFDLVIEHGYENLTMDAVAALAHTSKATLYRHWNDKTALVTGALVGLLPSEEPADLPDTGSFAGDLYALNEFRDDRLDALGDVVVPLLNAARHEPALQRLIRDYINGYVDLLVSRAVARGEIDAERSALRHLKVIIAAPRGFAHLLGFTADRRYVRDYIDTVVLPLVGLDPALDTPKES